MSDQVSHRLAELIASRPQLPPDVTTNVQSHILDTLGCMVAFAALPWSRALHEYATYGRTGGPATIAHYGSRAPVELAAFANGGFAHGFEMDDTEMRTASHPGVVVVPAALAVAEQAGSSGQDLLTAVALGYETMIRIGLASVGMIRRGFHTTAATGVFGASAATASLWSLNADVTAHGLGIAASRASGITEYSVSGGSVKRLHAGFPAQSGIESANLARFGVTAPAGAIDGERGFLSAFAGVQNADVITRDLATTWELLTTGFKPYCCCAGQHTVLDAINRMLQSRPSLDSAEIRSIRVRQNAREARVVGTTKRPVDITGAQFSAAFGVAMRLTGAKNGFKDYLCADLCDEQLLAVAEKVEYEETAESAQLDGQGPAEVTMTLTDGTRLEEYVAAAHGSFEDPMTVAEVLAKFHELVDDVLGNSTANRVADMVLNLADVKDVGQLATLLIARNDYVPLKR